MGTARVGLSAASGRKVSVILTVPYARPPMLANDQRRSHYRTVAAAKREVTEMVGWAAKSAHLGPCGPSAVTITWFVPDKRRRDPDSLAPFAKAALDGLVHAGVWPDDNSEWVRRLILEIRHDRANPRIEIRIDEIRSATTAEGSSP